MRVLVDTHAFFWWFADDDRLSARGLAILEDDENEVLLSSVVAWELATKGRLGKWPSAIEAANEIDKLVESRSIHPLPISIEHARAAGLLVGSHRDPFDRLLAAQAHIERVPLLTVDRVFRDFSVEILW